MRKIQTEILVIGGGATGSGIVRDLALRGFKTVLVERRDLSDGTTGRYHGLLHSGARYAVKDPLAAQECIEENRILRRILPQCIEDTGGFFVLTPEDDPAYASHLIAGCQQAGISIEEISIPEMLRQEPLLDPAIRRCLRVPDGAADSFLATRLNAGAAQAHGAQILRYHPVKQLATCGEGSARRVCGAICQDLLKDEEVRIDASLVINAAGAWAGKIAATVGIVIQMTPGKGVMLASNRRLVNTVINRCKMPGDGDILVPAHTVAVIGTTDTKVPDPDLFGIEDWEVQLMLDEGEKLIPGFRQMRFLRAWAGVRPLYQESPRPDSGLQASLSTHPANGSQPPLPAPQPAPSENRAITRAFVLLDHDSRDGVAGLLTITGGKWTTYRKMAEITVDRACEILGTQRQCRTHLEAIGDPHDHQAKTAHPSLGHRLAHIENQEAYGQLVCECELATRHDVERAIQEKGAYSLDDIRREVRLGKGPCQAGFCTLRAAGILHQFPAGRSPSQTNTALRDFLQERWKGVLPVLWGQQLRQERLNELIYMDVLNVPALTGARQSALAATAYTRSTTTAQARKADETASHPLAPAETSTLQAASPVDVLVVGAGLSGLMTAWLCAESGRKVKLISKGAGATHWASGCVDVLGYRPSPDDQNQQLITAPQQALAELASSSPKHPYVRMGTNTLLAAMRKLQVLCEQAGYPLHGKGEQNWLLPTSSGALRPTCLAPASFIAGDASQPGKMLIVGFEQFLDFFPALIADNLNAQEIAAAACLLDLPSLHKRRFVNATILAHCFDTPGFRREVAWAIRPHLAGIARVGLPAVLGLQQASQALADLQEQLGLPVFEISGLPPSIPGIRLAKLLSDAIRKAGGQVFDGIQVLAATGEDRHLTAFKSEAAARPQWHAATHFVLATGGILGGGIHTYSDGSVRESILGLPIPAPENRLQWLDTDFFSAQGHLIFHTGLATNETLQPVDAAGQPYYDNLSIVGGLLGDCDGLRERSLEGICLASAQVVSDSLRK